MARVLIVDDERPVLRTLSEFVKEDSHEVLTAEDADHAMILIKEHGPDVAVVDIVLPRISGSTLLGRIREEAPNTQVIMITGEPTVETAAAAVRDGAYDYLSKPITREAIRTAVASAVRVKALHDERERLEAENERYREHLEEEVARKTEALRQSEARYRAVVENAVETIFVVSHGVIRFANASAKALTGFSVRELTESEKPFGDFIHPDDATWVAEQHERRMRGEKVPALMEFRIVHKDGATRWIELRVVRLEWEGEPATLNIANDITERVEAERKDRARRERLQQSNEVLLRLATQESQRGRDLEEILKLICQESAQVLDVAAVGVWTLDASLMLKCRALEHREGATRVPVADFSLPEYPVFHEALSKNRTIATRNVREDSRLAEMDLDRLTSAGVQSILDAPVFVGGALAGDITFFHIGPQREWTHEDQEFAASAADLVSMAMETAHRHAAQSALTRSEREYRSLFENSPMALLHEDFSSARERILELKAEGVADLESYLCSHPDVLDDLVGRVRVLDVNEAACALHRAHSKDQLLAGLEVMVCDETRESLIRQMTSIANGEMQFDDISVNRTISGDPVDIWVRWSVVSGHEETLDQVLVAKIDISRRLRAERQLRDALDGTIEAIGLTTETRDPYTAGHQRNVTELAVAIAKEMACDATMIDGVRAAGLMHDIGKMAIPAEILSKPSRLTETELALIQMHPQVAYDILKMVAFPWPVAEIVRQHHERLDGNGYPRGLSGDEIRIEARILSVADVVEAIASHRPYRAALGIDVALAEIEQGRGTTYDARAVDACLRLFREKHFAFSNHHPV